MVQETEISRWEVGDFFPKLTFHMNKTFQSRGKSLHLRFANEAIF